MRTAKNVGAILLWSILVSLPVVRSWADGGYVIETESVAISADQRAILIMNSNDISMTLSTGYTGDGEDFGWVIPTPVPPAIEDVFESGEVGESAFEFLDQMTAPIELSESHKSHSGCFPSGTAVLTSDGLSPIEAVSPGTEVYACDLTSDRWVLATVLRRQAFEWEGDMITIEMGRHTIQATGNQPIYVVRGEGLSFRPISQEISMEDQRVAGQGRWVEARDLKEGDILKKKNGSVLTITGIVSMQQNQRVYCLEVEHFHNCAVHREGILVHNGGKLETTAPTVSKTLVTVYGRATLEHYEISVLGAAETSSLLEWLQVENYRVSPETKDIFDDYVGRNWAFVAVKLRPSDRRHYENEYLPPLTIRYQYDQLVFPLLISSISPVQQVRITLYVIAKNAAISSNYQTSELVYDHSYPISEEYVETCIQDTLGDQGKALVILWSGRYCIDWNERFTDSSYDPSFGFDRVNELFGSALPECELYLTRLEARMNPTDMSEDIWLVFRPRGDFEVVFGGTHWGSSLHVPTSDETTPTGIITTEESKPLTSVSEPELILAARDRDDEADIVTRLLDRGAEVDVRGRDSWTPLMYAALKPIFDTSRGLNALIPYTVRSGCSTRRICGAIERNKCLIN